jgi:hypothetical protein
MGLDQRLLTSRLSSIAPLRRVAIGTTQLAEVSSSRLITAGSVAPVSGRFPWRRDRRSRCFAFAHPTVAEAACWYQNRRRRPGDAQTPAWRRAVKSAAPSRRSGTRTPRRR